MACSKKKLPIFVLVSLAPLLLFCGLAESESDTKLESTGCEEQAGITPICGVRNPEDLALVPNQNFLLVSEYENPFSGKAGRISAVHLESLEVTQLYPPQQESKAAEWGDPSCKEVPKENFSPHGIDLARRSDGRLQLLVVNHGTRESVEFFEVSSDDERIALHWRGCVVAPATSSLNDVVSLSEGDGFLVTHMGENATSFWGKLDAIRAMYFRARTGHVLEWSPSEGLAVVSGTDSVYPNGIEVSPDGEFIFLNEYFADRVSKIRRSTGEVVAEVEVVHPDNSSWNERGQLLVASQPMSMSEVFRCVEEGPEPCPSRSSVVALDPDTLEAKEIFAHEGAPIGPATVAVQHGKQLYLGTFAGDRIGRRTMPD